MLFEIKKSSQAELDGLEVALSQKIDEAVSLGTYGVATANLRQFYRKKQETVLRHADLVLKQYGLDNRVLLRTSQGRLFEIFDSDDKKFLRYKFGLVDKSKF